MGAIRSQSRASRDPERGRCVEIGFLDTNKVNVMGVIAIEVPQNEEICGGVKDGGRKGVSSAISPRRTNRGSINIKERERGEVVWRDVDPYINSEKDKPCLANMMTLPLTCVASGERLPDW